MEPRPAYALVGLFVLLLGGALFASAVWLGAGHGELQSDYYHAYLEESVIGLNVKSSVRYRGVDVGRVSRIELDPDDPGRVRLLLSLDAGTPVSVATVARLATIGITGLAYVELRGGTRDSAPLRAAAGAAYPVIPTEPSLRGQLEQAAPDLLAEVRATLQALGAATERTRALFSDANLEALGSILADLQRLGAMLAGRSEQLAGGIDDLGRLLEHGVAASARFPALVERADGTLVRLEQAALAAGEASQAINQLAGRLDIAVARLSGSTLGEVERAAGLTSQELQRFAVDTQPELLGLIEELRSAALSLRRLGRELEHDPSLVLFGRRDVQPGPGEEVGQ
ncbi:MAG TPA: MlaD family protein [Gammaproteobacteria bacterium]